MARGAGCEGGKLPFVYLGVPVGASMQRVNAWNPVIDKMKSKLASWKAKMISFGGTLTLVKSVLGSTSLYFTSLFRTPSGVLNKLESIHRNFFWGGGNWESTRFWDHIWWGEVTLGKMFPRLARLEDRVEASIAERGEWVENKWVWKWGWRRNRRGREVGVTTGNFFSSQDTRRLGTKSLDFALIAKLFKKVEHQSEETTQDHSDKSRKVVKKCTLSLAGKDFSIDLIPIKIGSFDIIIGMDWMSNHRATICCAEKIVMIALPDGSVLEVHGEKPKRDIKIVSYMKMRSHLRKECVAFLAHVVDKEIKEKRIQDFPVVRDYPEVFPEELPGLPRIGKWSSKSI
ncbi:hypothetical protein OSB04_027380 [Centaurea solstitialis]|uniref:Reverse transcriptase domain-containing protein n=1 Tax=Centaurea solstitialis TaxID=347529 RepID=A0AA38W877_9ASTR|nr:hypothetical protein OSB04_027380 [Centaurea solstitialis]